jgi:hypothetical protein
MVGAIQYNALANFAVLEGRLADELTIIFGVSRRCGVFQLTVQRPIGNQVRMDG